MVAQGLPDGTIARRIPGEIRKRGVYSRGPDILHLHGVTGAMAVEILAAHIPAADGAAALTHVHAEHAALYAATEPVTQPHRAGPARLCARRGGRAQPGPAPG